MTNCEMDPKEVSLYCYELLTMQYIEQSQDELIWQKLQDWNQDKLSTVQVIVSLSKELWFIAVFLRENPVRLKEFLTKFRRLSLLSDEEDLLVSYLMSFALTELYLDTTFRSNVDSSNSDLSVATTAMSTQITQSLNFRPPLAIFRLVHLISFILNLISNAECVCRCCPYVKVLSLKNNNLNHLPPDIGRLNNLQKLYLTNNRLQNGSIPYTLAFCTQLKELYLDDNLLDALPSVLLRIPSLKTVHRHGNHNYFKSTFMWYHTDVTGRILPTNPTMEDNETRRSQLDHDYDQLNLQNIAARVIIASRTNFYAAEIPFRLKNYISDMVNTVNPCENCSTVKGFHDPGFKVFTFRNPYLGNTCVPFLHWACDYNCAREIEIPARRQQILSAKEQDKIYEDYVRQAVDLMPSSSRSLSNISVQSGRSSPSPGTSQSMSISGSPGAMSASSTSCCIAPQSDDLAYQATQQNASCRIL